MSYRCEACGIVCPAGQMRRKHIIRRPDGNIERELAVCEGCQRDLALGTDPTLLRHRHAAQCTYEGHGAAVKVVVPTRVKAIPLPPPLAPIAADECLMFGTDVTEIDQPE